MALPDDTIFKENKENDRRILYKSIDSSRLNEQEKELLKRLMSNLLDGQIERIKALWERLEETEILTQTDSLPRITTGLMERRRFQSFQNGRNVSDLSMSEQGGFLLGSYEKAAALMALNNRQCYTGEYRGKPFSYRLCQSNDLMYIEHQLLDLLDFYNFSDLTIYAPLFRRYVLVEPVDADEKVNWAQVDFCLEENGLDGVLYSCRDYVCYANWSCRSETPDIKQASSGVEDGNAIKFHFPRCGYEKGYVWLEDASFSMLSSNAEWYAEGEGQDLVISVEANSSPYEFSFVRYLFEETGSDQPEAIMVFQSWLRGKNLLPQRILSIADIEAVMESMHSQLGIQRESVSIGVKPDGLRLCHYPSEQEYRTGRGFYRKNQFRIYLVFQKNEDPFLLDRIVYVLSCLNTFYPEYQWLGGCYD